MPDQHISFVRGASLAESERGVYNFLVDSLSPSCRVWQGIRVSDPTRGRTHECDLLVLGHYGLYVVEIKSLQSTNAVDRIRDALDQVRRYSRLFAAAIDGDPPGTREWLESVVVLAPPGEWEPDKAHPYVLTPLQLVHAAESGELPGVPGPPRREPLQAELIQDIEQALDNLGRRSQRQRRQGVLARLRQLLVAELVVQSPTATRRELEDTATFWIVSTCFLLLAETRGWTPRQLLRSDEAPRSALQDLRHALTTTIRLPGTRALFDAENPWDHESLSETGAHELLSSLQRLICDSPDDWYSFGDAWSDLYEAQSEEQRKEYGFLTTPRFISEFLCMRTLEPALAAYGADFVRVIDPACGGGTILCGAFHCLLDTTNEHSTVPVPRALHALDRVTGIDISVGAALITRTRLLVALLERIDAPHLDKLPSVPLHVSVADALLTPIASRYHAVICEPPLVTCRDSTKHAQYRSLYPDSARQNSPIAAPFVERCFQFAETGAFVGIFTSNSFIKRQFGKQLVEDVLVSLDIGAIVDASLAFIPHHGTSMLMIFGRNRPPHGDTILVLGNKQGEPRTPPTPEEGLVWQAIAAHHATPGYEDEWVAVMLVSRTSLLRHPMELSFGPQREIVAAIAAAATVTLRDLASSIGHGATSGADDVFVLPLDASKRMQLKDPFVLPYLTRYSIRAWTAQPEEVAIAFELLETNETQRTTSTAWRALHPYHSILAERPHSPSLDEPRHWWCWQRWPAHAASERPRILTPMIARTASFALDTSGALVGRSLLWIELANPDAEHRNALLAYLNSTTARCWLRNACHTLQEHIRLDPAPLGRLPIPDAVWKSGPERVLLAALAHQQLVDADALRACAPDHVLAHSQDSGQTTLLERLADAQATERKLLRRMVRCLEDIDWVVYRIFHFSDEPGVTPEGSALPDHRPFTWRSDKPPPSIDSRLSVGWSRRRDAIARSMVLRTLESPWFKERYEFIGRPPVKLDDKDEVHGPNQARPRRTDHTFRMKGYRSRITEAIAGRVRQIIEATFASQTIPQCISTADVAALSSGSEGLRAVLSLLPQTSPNLTSIQYIFNLLAGHSTPYLSALRYTDAGLAKRAAWERAWRDPAVPTPPRYSRQDYRSAIIWQHRGRLDRELEAFIAYPNAASDGSILYGWTAWDVDTRAAILWSLYRERSKKGPSRACLAPLLAGLYDLAVTFRPIANPDTFLANLEAEARQLGMSMEELRSSRPEAEAPTKQ